MQLVMTMELLIMECIERCTLNRVVVIVIVAKIFQAILRLDLVEALTLHMYIDDCHVDNEDGGYPNPRPEDGNSSLMSSNSNNTFKITKPNNSLKVAPNPFWDEVNISYYISENSLGDISVELYDGLGQKIKTIVKESVDSDGFYSVNFDGSFLSSGIYYCILQSKYEKIAHKVIKFKY